MKKLGRQGERKRWAEPLCAAPAVKGDVSMLPAQDCAPFVGNGDVKLSPVKFATA
jgi:hypothetical protein